MCPLHIKVCRRCTRLAREADNASDGLQGTGELGLPLHYKGSKLHRIIPGFMAQVPPCAHI